VNTYGTGKLGIAEGIALVFSLVIPRLFLSGLSNVLQESGQLLWLSMIIYTIIPLVVFYMMVYVHNNISGDIVAVCEQLVGKLGSWVIIVAYIGMFLGNSALILRQYAEYTLTTALPEVEFQLVIIWYTVSIGIICYLGIEALCRSAYIVLPIVLGGLAVVFVLLAPYYVVYNLTPWQGNGIMVAIRIGINDVGFNLGILSLIFLSSAFQNTKTIKIIALYVTGGAVMLRIVFTLVYTMVFGVEAGAEKAMPFFEMARLVYLNEYFQRIEALFIVVWVISGLLSIAGFLFIGLYLIAFLLKLPTLRPIVPLGIVIIANLAMLPPDIGYAVQVDQLIVQLSKIGIYVFPVVLFFMTLVKKRRKKTCTAS